MSVIVQGNGSSTNQKYSSHENLSIDLSIVKVEGLDGQQQYYNSHTSTTKVRIKHSHNHSTIDRNSPYSKHDKWSNRKRQCRFSESESRTYQYSVPQVSSPVQQLYSNSKFSDTPDGFGTKSQKQHQLEQNKRWTSTTTVHKSVNKEQKIPRKSSHAKYRNDGSRCGGINRVRTKELSTINDITTNEKSVSNCISSDANPQEDSSLSPKIYSNVVITPIDELPEMPLPTANMLDEIHLKPDNNRDSNYSVVTVQANNSKKRYLSTDTEANILQTPLLCKEQPAESNVGSSDDASSLDLLKVTKKRCNDTSKITVGTRVAVFWDGEGRYYTGTIRKYIPGRKKPFYIKYEDGDREWMDLRKEKFKIVKIAPENPSNDKASKLLQDGNAVNSTSNQIDDWVGAGIMRNDSDTDTDDEEVTQWARKMFGIAAPIARPKHSSFANDNTKYLLSPLCNPPWSNSLYNDGIPMSISEKVKLGRRNRTTTLVGQPLESATKGHLLSKLSIKKSKALPLTEDEADAKLKKLQARPLTNAEIKSILGDDCIEMESTNWVRRSVRQPSKSTLNAPRVKELLEKLVSNDSDMVVLKMKKYCSDLDTPSIVIDAVLDALEENTNCEALYIQNFNEGMRDKQVLHLMRVLQRPTCKIWCLNIGETYKVQMKTWEKFTSGLAKTNITHMYASEHTITSELKEQIRETIRKNRSKHHYHDDPANLETIVRCTHCWWNPINAKSLRPFIQRKEYEHILRDAEAQGLRGTMTGADLS